MPMDRSKYPDQWNAIATSVKEAAEWRCEKCGMQCRRPGEAFDTHKRTLTVAHINHVEQDCREENLVALCSGCHLQYDGMRRSMQALARKRITRTERIMTEKTWPAVFAFDCFGTVFDMRTVAHGEIRAYVEHVNRDDFSPFSFPRSWYELKAHPDSAAGIALLRYMGMRCVTLSNGSADLIEAISKANGIEWDLVIDLAKVQAYKPRNLDAYRQAYKQTGVEANQVVMVTANPTFGDVEGASAVGMQSVVIRHGSPNTIVELAERYRTQWMKSLKDAT